MWPGLICGAVTPLVSFLSSGRPPFPDGLIPMTPELAAYGFLSGLLRGLFVKNPKTQKVSGLLAVALSMVAGRAVNALAGAIILAANGAPFFLSLGTKFLQNFTSTWAGIVVQLALIPVIMLALQKSGVLLKYTLPDEQQ